MFVLPIVFAGRWRGDIPSSGSAVQSRRYGRLHLSRSKWPAVCQCRSEGFEGSDQKWRGESDDVRIGGYFGLQGRECQLYYPASLKEVARAATSIRGGKRIRRWLGGEPVRKLPWAGDTNFSYCIYHCPLLIA